MAGKKKEKNPNLTFTTLLARGELSGKSGLPQMYSVDSLLQVFLTINYVGNRLCACAMSNTGRSLDHTPFFSHDRENVTHQIRET